MGNLDDDIDAGYSGQPKRRKVQVNFEISILEKFSKSEKFEENYIPWIQIVQRLVEKFPKVFIESYVLLPFFEACPCLFLFLSFLLTVNSK